MKRHVIVICFLAVCFWSTPGVKGAELRTWTSKADKFTIKAELLSFDQEVVSLRRDDGKTIKVPLAKLSKEDQEYVLDQPKPKAEPVAAREEKSVAELEKLGAIFFQHPQGEIVEVDLSNKKDLTDAYQGADQARESRPLLQPSYSRGRCRAEEGFAEM